MPEANRRRFLQLAGATRPSAPCPPASSAPRPAGQPPHRVDRGRRAHRRPHAGEPLLRPLLPGTLRGVRGFPATPARSPSATANRSGTRRRTARNCCPSTRTPTTSACSSWRACRTPGPTASRPTTAAHTTGGCPPRHHDHGVPDPRGHPLPLRPRRRLHRLRRLPLLVHRLHRPQPLLHVVQVHRQRRHRRRPGPGQRRTRLRLDHLPRAPGTGRHLLEDLPGHRRRPGRGGSWGWIQDAYRGNYGDNSLLYFDTYRNAQPGDPWYDKARTGTDVKNGDGYFDHLRADVKAGKLPQISWIAAPKPSPSTPTGPPTTAPGTSPRSWTPSPPTPDVWSKTALFITYDENDGFFDHVVPPLPPKDASPRPVHRRRHPDLFPGDGRRTACPYGLGPRVPMLVVSPWSKGGYVCSRLSTHLDPAVHGTPFRRARDEHLAVAPGDLR